MTAPLDLAHFVHDGLTGPRHVRMTEDTVRHWYGKDDEGKPRRLILTYDSSDREPYYIKEQFYSLEALEELGEAIRQALDKAESLGGRA